MHSHEILIRITFLKILLTGEFANTSFLTSSQVTRFINIEYNVPGIMIPTGLLAVNAKSMHGIEPKTVLEKGLFRVSVCMICFILLSGCRPLARKEINKPDQVHRNAWDLAILVNEHRKKKGLPVLRWDESLYRVALRHTEDMRDRDFFSHYNPDLESPFDRLGEFRITYHYAAENLAVGQVTPEEVFSNWMRSPEHRGNIRSCLYTHHAVAYDPKGNYWTHLFIESEYTGSIMMPQANGWYYYNRNFLL